MPHISYSFIHSRSRSQAPYLIVPILCSTRATVGLQSRASSHVSVNQTGKKNRPSSAKIPISRQIIGPSRLGLAALSTTNLRALLRLPRNPPLPDAASRPCSKGTTSPKSALRFSRPLTCIATTSTNFAQGRLTHSSTATNSRR